MADVLAVRGVYFMARKKSRAASGTGSIRQRPDGTWEGRLTVGTDPGTGKTIRRSVYGKTQAEVRKKMTTVQKEIDTGTYLLPDKITVSQWLDTWLATFCVGRLKPLTCETYASVIKNHIRPRIGAMRLQEVRGIQIQKIYNEMTAGGLSGKTVKNVAAVMHKAFTVAAKQGLIPVNPCDAAELLVATAKEIKPLADAEIPLFLQAIENDPYRNAFALCLFAGLREAECLGLSWKQVDFEKKQITINQ